MQPTVHSYQSGELRTSAKLKALERSLQPCKLCVTQHHFSNRPGAEGSIAAVSDVKHQPHILPCKRLEISSWLELSCRQASHPCAFVSPMSQTTLGSWTSLEGLIPGGHAGCCTPVRACRDPDAAVGVWELGSHPSKGLDGIHDAERSGEPTRTEASRSCVATCVRKQLILPMHICSCRSQSPSWCRIFCTNSSCGSTTQTED